MNETILASAGDRIGLTVSIAPWPLAGPVDSTAMRNVESRVDSATGRLVLSPGAGLMAVAPLDRLHRLLTAALALIRHAPEASAKLEFSGLSLNSGQLAAALGEWRDDSVPVLSLIAFDFAVRGIPPGMRSTGLAPLAGQEIVAWPRDGVLRPACARMVVRLAHDLLLHGPVLAECTVPAPEVPGGMVTLLPRELPERVVEIRF